MPKVKDSRVKTLEVDGTFVNFANPNDGQILTYVSSIEEWRAQDPQVAGTLTASNEGTAGVGVFIQRTGDNFEFKNINTLAGNLNVIDDVGNDEIDLDLTDTSVTAGSYTYSSITVDSKGRLTAASNGITPSPINATYVTVTPDGTLTAERALTSGTNISLVDGGPNSTITINVDASGVDTQIQYNDSGSLAGNANLSFNKNNTLHVPIVGHGTASSQFKILGHNYTATGEGLMFGDMSAQTTPGTSVALGLTSSAGATESIAIGNGANAGGDDSVAIGRSSVTVGDDTVSIGDSANAGGLNSIAIGLTSSSGSTASISIGVSSAVTGSNAIALGNSMENDIDDSHLVLGGSLIQNTTNGSQATAHREWAGKPTVYATQVIDLTIAGPTNYDIVVPSAASFFPIQIRIQQITTGSANATINLGDTAGNNTYHPSILQGNDAAGSLVTYSGLDVETNPATNTLRTNVAGVASAGTCRVYWYGLLVQNE